MTSNTCSVIVPIYNAAPFLAQCLSSIRMQTYQDLQVILVDDGSTDESAEIAQSFVDADQRFSMLKQPHQGQSVARNNGLNNATGKYLVFVDADDYINPTYVEQHIAVIGDANYVQTGYRRVTTDGETIAQKLPLHRYQFTSPCMRLYRLDWLQQHAFAFPQGMIYEDVVFSMQLWATRPHVCMLPYVGYNYTFNPSSTTTSIQRPAQHTLYHVLRQLSCPWWLKQYTLLRLRFHFFLSTLSHD